MKKLKKGIPFLIYMMIWSLYILFAWSRTHPGQIIEVSLFILKSCFAPCWYFCLFMIQYA